MTTPDGTPFRCVLDAWQTHEADLRHWLLSRLDDAALAEDILQDILVKACTKGGTSACSTRRGPGSIRWLAMP